MKKTIPLSERHFGWIDSLLKSRMERFIHTLPPPMQSDVQTYLRFSRLMKTRRRSSGSAREFQPYWFLLPVWLEQAFYTRRNGSAPLDRQFINDVLWAQYCLFLQVRIHDDLFDRHKSDIALIFAADQFRLESDRVLSKHFPRTSRFWTVYRTSLDETNRSFIELKSVQNSKSPAPEQILAIYSRGYAILKVGFAAVCAKMRRMRHLPTVSRFADEMAKVGQALDDLTDIHEDLGRGELTYLSAYILQTRGMRGSVGKRALTQILHPALVDDSLPGFFRELRVHLRNASRALRPLKIEAASEYLHRYESVLAAIENHYFRRRIRLVFGDLARSSS